MDKICADNNREIFRNSCEIRWFSFTNELFGQYWNDYGKIMEGSGLYKLVNTCYGSNAVYHMFSGKAFSRALRAHILADLALCFKLVEKSCNEDDIIQLKLLY